MLPQADRRELPVRGPGSAHAHGHGAYARPEACANRRRRGRLQRLPETFAQNVEQAVQALLANGAKRILWVNLREAQGQYPGMNAVLVAAAHRYPELTVVDWNATTSGHPEWFQNDGIHLVHPGAIALATLIRTALDQPTAPPTVTPQQASAPAGAALAAAERAREQPSGGYVPRSSPLGCPAPTLATATSARCRTGGGVAPFRWTLSWGALPRGLRLEASGRITGTPTSARRASFVVTVTDAHGAKATRRELIARQQPVGLSALGPLDVALLASSLRHTAAKDPRPDLRATATFAACPPVWGSASVSEPCAWPTRHVGQRAGGAVVVCGRGHPPAPARMTAPTGTSRGSQDRSYVASTLCDRSAEVPPPSFECFWVSNQMGGG